MSSIHYKLKSTLDYKTLTFQGPSISTPELRQAICEREKIRIDSFDVLILNPITKRHYSEDELIPRNSSVVYQRLPRELGPKLPKVKDVSSSGIVTRHVNSVKPQSYMRLDQFSTMSEEQRLAYVKEVSYQKYHPTNYQKQRAFTHYHGTPPPSYTCNRCGNTGHWYRNCPMANIRRTTGIPTEELMVTTSDDPQAMLHPSGRYMKSKMHHQARISSKQKALKPWELENEDRKRKASENTGTSCVKRPYGQVDRSRRWS